MGVGWGERGGGGVSFEGVLRTNLAMLCITCKSNSLLAYIPRV